MTLTGTAKPGVSTATLAGQIDLLKGYPGGSLLQLDMTIIGRLKYVGTILALTRASVTSALLKRATSKLRQDVEAILEAPVTMASLATRRLRDGPSLQVVDGPITRLTLQTDAVNRSVLLDLLYGAAVPVSAKLGLGKPTGSVTSARCEFPVKPVADVI